jgi:hypothetical protein
VEKSGEVRVLPYFCGEFYQNCLSVKKLLTLVLVLWFGAMKAQDLGLQNSIAVVAGPNWYCQDFDLYAAGGVFSPRIGYSLGLDYTLEVAKHWHVKVGFRYNFLRYKAVLTYLYDPTLPAEEFASIETARYWQYLAGIRWLSKPKTWRFYADGELGLSDLKEDEGNPKQKPQPTVGIGFGLAWQKAGSKLAVFAQPNIRYVFPQQSSLAVRSNAHFFMPALEMGVRRYF